MSAHIDQSIGVGCGLHNVGFKRHSVVLDRHTIWELTMPNTAAVLELH